MSVAPMTRPHRPETGLASALPVRSVVPPSEPPYDDPVAGEPGRDHGEARWCTDGSLALTLPLELPARRARLRLVPDAPARDPRTGRDITPADMLSAPGPRAVQLVRAVLEVLSGDRPATHLCRVTAPLVQEQIEDAARVRSARPWARSVRSLHLSEPSPGVAEVTAVVDRGNRSCALGLRLQGLDGRWIITELALV